MTEYLTPSEAAALIPGMTVVALAQHRYRGTGPVFLKPSPRMVLYRRADVVAWLEGNERISTREVA